MQAQAGLLPDDGNQPRMTVSQGRHAGTRKKIQIPAALCVLEITTLASLNGDRVAIVCMCEDIPLSVAGKLCGTGQ